MRQHTIAKELIVILVFILIGSSFEGVTATPKDTISSTLQTTQPLTPQQYPREENLATYLSCLDSETLHHIYQAQAAGIDMYVVFSTSGTGRTLHVFLKIPHLRNSRGIFVFGMIINTGITAMTTVWRLENGTNGTLVDAQIGPHGVMFMGVGYSTYNKNLKGGGAGTMLGVSPLQPFLFP